MSNAWTVACRPFAGLRSFSLLPPWTITRTACGIASPKTSAPHISRFSTTTTLLRCYRTQSLSLLRPFALRSFSTTSAYNAKRKSAKTQPKPSAQSTPKDSDHGKQEKEDMPLPNGDLPQRKIAEIFGAGVSAADGNAVLRALQHRRVSGSLAERGVHFDNQPKITYELAMSALQYLRVEYPVDEEAAAARWTEEQAQKLEEELIARAEDLGIYKRTESQTKEDIYGYSQLEAIRRRNEAAWEKDEKEKAEKKAKEEEELERQGKTGELARIRGVGELTQRKEKSEFVKYYEEQAMLSKAKAAPTMSAARRILPSLAVASITLLFCYFLATNYTPPQRSARLFPDTPPAIATCAGVLAVNFLVFVAWRIPPFWRTLNKYFMQTPGYPTALSVVGNVFSHQEFLHLFWNMLLLMGAGTQLHDLVGRGNFLAIYLAGGVLGSAASLSWFTLTRNLGTSSLGASGAISAVIGALLLLKDADHIGLPFSDKQIPVSSRALLACFLAYEVYGLSRGKGATGMDHVAHLGGYAAGVTAAAGIKYSVAERRRREEEKKKEMGFLQRSFYPGASKNE